MYIGNKYTIPCSVSELEQFDRNAEGRRTRAFLQYTGAGYLLYGFELVIAISKK